MAMDGTQSFIATMSNPLDDVIRSPLGASIYNPLIIPDEGFTSVRDGLIAFKGLTCLENEIENSDYEHSINCSIVSCSEVAPEVVPEWFSMILISEKHMTQMLEHRHGCRASLKILHKWCGKGVVCPSSRISHEENVYYRHILLREEFTEAAMEFATMRLLLDRLLPSVREGVIKGDVPLGLLLSSSYNDRKVVVKKLFRLDECSFVWKALGVHTVSQNPNKSTAPPLWGRSAVIYLDGEPLIHVLEVLPPK